MGTQLWKINYRFALDEEDHGYIPNPPQHFITKYIVRYAQLGLQQSGFFTGYVHDYCGGGSWLKLWYLDGRQFDSEYFDFADPYVLRIARKAIETKYPGLCARIDAELKKHVIWRDGVPYARPLTRKKWEGIAQGHLLALGELTPVDIGNTMFSEKAPEREPLIVLENSNVVSWKLFKRIQQQDEFEATKELNPVSVSQST